MTFNVLLYLYIFLTLICYYAVMHSPYCRSAFLSAINEDNVIISVANFEELHSSVHTPKSQFCESKAGFGLHRMKI